MCPTWTTGPNRLVEALSGLRTGARERRRQFQQIILSERLLLKYLAKICHGCALKQDIVMDRNLENENYEKLTHKAKTESSGYRH